MEIMQGFHNRIMVKIDNKKCRDYGATSPKNMESVIAFVFSSIRVQTALLPRFMREYKRRGLASSWLWGNKKTGLSYVIKHRNQLFKDYQQILKSKKGSCEHDLIMLFLDVPGLGIPKSAFVVQMLTGKSGCMDVHNIRKYMPELDAGKGTPAIFQTSGNSTSLKSKKVNQYIVACKKAGGSQKMWDAWCNHIAVLQPKHFLDGEAVSNMHHEVLT